MLSRVASHIYWFGRYIERAESTARLVRVHDNLMLDLPPRTKVGWAPLVAITGNEAAFASLYETADEASAVRFLVADDRHPSSMVSSIAAARENLRTTRDIVPREAWEQVNELFLYLREQGERALQRRFRPAILDRVVRTNQQLVGLLGSTMSRGDAFNFLRLGYNLERADMTTRIIDIRSESLLLSADVAELAPFQQIQWMSVLKSLTAYQMYRQSERVRVSGPAVLRFLLQDERFPHAVRFCLDRIEAGLTRLPRNKACLAADRKLQKTVAGAKVEALVTAGFSEFLDGLQLAFAQLNDAIAETYF